MSNLSDLLPAGASGKKATFTASGTISTGNTVILNTDGTVSVVAAVAESSGTTTTFQSGTNNEWVSATYLGSNNKLLIAYRNGSNNDYGTAVIGTVSGTSISFGTPTVFYSAAIDNQTSCAYAPTSDRVCVTFKAITWGRSALLSISGTTLTLENDNDFYGANAGETSVCYHAANDRFVVAVRGAANSNYGYLYASTSNGSASLSWGGASNFNAGGSYALKVAYDPVEEVVVVFYRDNGNSNYGTARAATLSGTSFSYGTEAVFNSAATQSAGFLAASFDSDTNQFVVAFRNDGASNYPYAITCKATGTALSFGSSVQVAAHASTNYGAVYDTVNKKAVVVVEDASDRPTAFVCTVSGTSISVSSGFVITTATTGSGINGHMTAVYDESQSKVVVPQVNTSDSKRGVATVYQPPSSNALPAPKFVGIAQEDIANAASGEVVLVGGISENATSEVTTTNSTVYLQADGSLSTTVASIEAGLAFGDTTVTGYYLEGTVYDNVQYSHGNETNPAGLAFKSDGTKFYILGTTQDTVYQYSLSTAWDMSTASYDSVSFSVLAQATTVTGLCFSTDGTKFYVTDNGTNAVYQYTLSTAWDLSTASYASKSMSTQGTSPGDGFMHPSGTKFYTVDFSADVVQEYNLTTAFDISTGSYSQQFSVSSQETVPIAISFNSDGTEMYVAGQSQDTVFQYDLSTAYDISTASYASVSYDLSAQGINSPHGIAWKSDGTKMYIICNSTDKIYQYTTQVITTSKLLLNG